MSQNVTPFIPPLPSPNASPQPSAPVIPQQSQNDPVSPTWYQYSNPGAYPVYPTTPAVNMNGGYIPAYMSPVSMTPGFIPPTPLPPSASAFPAGVSQDYAGYPPTYPFAAQRPPAWAVPQGAPPPVSSYSQPMYSSPLPPQSAPAFGTPWTAGGGRPLYPAFGGAPMQAPPAQQQPMSAPGYGLGFGMQPAWAPQHFTPGPAMQPDLWGIQQAMGMGAPPPAAAAAAQPPPMHGPLHRAETHVGDRMDPFMPGDHYGPVLEPFLIRTVRAEVKLNPLIEPISDTGPERPFLKWNMLFHTSLVQRSTDPAHVSWSKGRNAPATFPRVSSMRIVSDIYPWMIEVRAQTQGGVTCGEVIESIYQNMQRLTHRDDYERLSPTQKRTLADAYRHNRSRTNGVPGGTLGEGMKRLDYLRDKVAFGGVEVNEAVVRRICGEVLPCTFVLRCQHMFPLTQQEARDHAARQRARASSANLSANASPNPRSRAASRSSRPASSPRPGIAVIPPSDRDDDDYDDDTG